MFRRLTSFVLNVRPAAGTVSAMQINISQPKQNKTADDRLLLKNTINGNAQFWSANCKVHS